MPPGKTFECILEQNKLDKIRLVITHNEGEVVSETLTGNDIRLVIKKISGESLPSSPK